MLDASEPAKPSEASELQPLLELAKSTYSDRLSQREANGPQPLLQRWDVRQGKLTSYLLWLSVCGGVAAATAIVVMALPKTPQTIAITPMQQPITFNVQGGSVEEGGYLRAAGTGAVTAMFSEGTRVTFAAGARGRVLNTTPVGGRLSLEQGRADVRVRHRRAAAWVVHAGPYAVEVTGTEFLVDWSPAQEQLELRLHKGSVTVRGPFAEAGIAMTAGQILTIALPAGRITLNQDGPAQTQPLSSSQSKPPLRHERERHERERQQPARAHRIDKATPAEEPTTTLSWSDQVAAGDFHAVLRDAEQQGLPRVLQEGSLAQISALADAARYARRSQLAKAALQAQRQRFPHAPQSREAVFFLARLAEDESRLGEAQALYDDYLNAPSVGLYAGEALGRKMLLERRKGDQAAAHALAKEYLAKYPNGSYATPARKLVGAR